MPGKPLMEGISATDAMNRLFKKADTQKTKHVEANSPIIEAEKPEEAEEERKEGDPHIPIETPALKGGKEMYLAYAGNK